MSRRILIVIHSDNSDVPTDAADFVLSIHFYTKGNESSGIVSSPSISSMSSLSNLKFFKKQQHQMFNFNDKIPASPQSLGVFLGELSLVVPASHQFAKIPSSHAINSPKKEVGRLSIQMGIYDDYHYIPLPVHLFNIGVTNGNDELCRLLELLSLHQRRSNLG